METNEEMKYCLEANYRIYKGTEIYNCIKCMKGFKLEYNTKLNISYCVYDRNNNKCLVKYCDTCEAGNNHFCSNCISSDFEIDKYTGSCVKKMEFVPFVTWKDVFRFNKTGQKEINGRIVKGPSFILRGITCNKISSRHAFLLNLLFGKNKGLKYLEEFQNITAICEIIEGEEEINPDINIVDYECIGNSTLDEDYTLSKIEKVIASGEKIISSLKEINNNTQILFNESKTSSNFSLNDSISIIKFTAQSIEKISTNTFVISGETNKIISKTRKLSEEITFLRKLSSNSECYNDEKWNLMSL